MSGFLVARQLDSASLASGAHAEGNAAACSLSLHMPGKCKAYLIDKSGDIPDALKTLLITSIQKNSKEVKNATRREEMKKLQRTQQPQRQEKPKSHAVSADSQGARHPRRSSVFATLEAFNTNLRESAFGRFMSGRDMSVEDFDNSVNAMALVCAVILTIPYQLMSTLGFQYFDWLREQLSACPGGQAQGYDFNTGLIAFREYVLCCSYSSICGMILSTFYYMFKRTDSQHLAQWKKKARQLVLVLFVCTCFSIISLVATSNFFLAWYFIGSGMICTSNALPYVGPACGAAFIVLVIAICLVY